MTMSRRWITPFGLIAFALLFQLRAHAEEFNVSPRTEELLKRGACWGCHGVDEVRIGPPFRNVAQRYRNSGSEQMEVLAAKIRFGGAGNWGAVPMFPHPELSRSETNELLKWILSLPPR